MGFYSTGSGFNPQRNKIIKKELSDQDERHTDRPTDSQTVGVQRRDGDKLYLLLHNSVGICFKNQK